MKPARASQFSDEASMESRLRATENAAVLKLVRLAGGVSAACGDKETEAALNEFLRTVPAGRQQRGLQSFLDCYMDSLLTCGRAVGEIVPAPGGRDIAAVLCGKRRTTIPFSANITAAMTNAAATTAASERNLRFSSA